MPAKNMKYFHTFYQIYCNSKKNIFFGNYKKNHTYFIPVSNSKITLLGDITLVMLIFSFWYIIGPIGFSGLRIKTHSLIFFSCELCHIFCMSDVNVVYESFRFIDLIPKT